MSKGFKVLSLISGLATVGSLVLDFLSGWAEDKKMDELVDQKVNEAFEKREQLPKPDSYRQTEIGFKNNGEA